MSFVVSFDNPEEVAAALRRAEDLADEYLRAAMELAVDMVAARARAEHDYIDRTSTLTSSIQGEPPTGSFREGSLEGLVAAGAPYAAAIEEGARPHKIVPRHRRVLRWPVEGGFRFADSVNHPGNRAYRFLGNAIERSMPDITREFEAAVDLALADAGFP